MMILLKALFGVITSVQSANILGVFVIPSVSHQVIFQPIWRELSLRGHQVTVVTPNPLKDPTLTNLTEIDVGNTYDIVKNMRIDELMSKDAFMFTKMTNIYEFTEKILDIELNNTQMQNILDDKNQKFDLVMLECVHPLLYGLSGRFNAPIICISSMGLFIPINDAVGNPCHPALYPDLFINFDNVELTLWQKIQSTAFSLWYRFYYHYDLVPRSQENAVKYFGDIPYLGDLEKNVSMVFANVNPFIFPPRPNVPAVVELGMIHIKPVKPLPKDLQTFLDEADEGVIYFSLGSNVKSVNLPEKLRETILQALSELPYKVLWKWESDHLPGKPDNVLIRKWLPQQDLLAHPNIKAFLTQGGLQSIEEAISRGVPLVGMPFMADQPLNVRRIVDTGIGLGVDSHTVTKDQLKNSIIEVAENRKYRDKINEIRDIISDKPMTGLENAVWWAEYVIRHKGAKHLRSSTADISWFHYLLLDIVLAIAFTIFSVVFVCKKLLAYLINRRSKLKQL